MELVYLLTSARAGKPKAGRGKSLSMCRNLGTSLLYQKWSKHGQAKFVFVRLKKIGSSRYVYLVEGVSENGRVRQKNLCYLGRISKIASGIPDETRRKIDRRVSRVDWNKVNREIRNIPLTFEESQEVKHRQLATILTIRQSGVQTTGRGSKPRAEGELLALTILARKSFNKMFRTIDDRKYVMR